MIDQNTDVTFATLRSLVSSYPAIVGHIKTANVGEHVRSSLPDSAFADRHNRLFPVHTPADAVLSKAYATKVANLAAHVSQEIDTALEMYGVSSDIFESSKVAAASVEEPKYLVKGQQKLAFYNSTPISAGEEALQRVQSKLKSKTITEGALTLVKEASKRGENVSDWTLKYAGLVQCDTTNARDWIEARAHKTSSSKLASAYTKLASVVSNLDGSIQRDDLIKVASTVGELDTMAGFTKYYGRSMPDPVATIFNTKLAMQPMMDLAGTAVPMEKLLAIPPETYGDILGSDIVEEITANGELMPDALSEILETLPIDMKKSLVAELGL
jgi:hypothetical protein